MTKHSIMTSSLTPLSRDFDTTLASLANITPYHIYGNVTEITGMRLVATAPHKKICVGSSITLHKNHQKYRGEVIAMEDGCAIILLASPILGLSVGDSVHFHLTPLTVSPNMHWMGRILSSFGEPLDNGPTLPLAIESSMSLALKPTRVPPIPAMHRATIDRVLDVGVRAINAFIPVCHGQRLGIFAGSGVGKSVLLSMLTRFSECDVCVIGLIGERGREVREFIEHTLGPDGLSKSIIVVATSDEPPLARRQAAYTTLTIAEYFRDQGLKVLCVLDSVTRFAMAQREIGLSAGEPPTTKGYPPSTFFELAQLCERAGPGYRSESIKDASKSITPGGHITGIFSVLVDGDDTNEPIADAVRGILDGHIVLDRTLAERGHFPAIHVLKSISRLTQIALTSKQKACAQEARSLLSMYQDMEDLIRLGAYKYGSHPDVDRAVTLYPKIEMFLKQDMQELTSIDETFQRLHDILTNA